MDNEQEYPWDGIELKSANAWMREASAKPVPRMLLDGLWLEGELAVMFGDTGVGKSVFATAAAESIARGRDLGPFETTAGPQRVLYVDLDLSAKQFEMRYTADHDPDKGNRLRRPYRFSERFQRVELGAEMLSPESVPGAIATGCTFESKLYRMLTALVRKAEAKVLIIDSISHLKRTADDTRGWATVLRALKSVKDELGISVLAIANTLKRSTWRQLAAGDALGSRLIACYADNIFAIGRCRIDPELRYIKHIRPRCGELVHGTDHVPVFRIAKIGGNFLGFEFQRFSTETDLLRPATESDRKTISEVKRLSDGGMSIRQISAELRISKSTVHRYLHAPELPSLSKEGWPPLGADGLVKNASEPPQPWNHFPGREEFDAARNDPRFDDIYDREDPEAYTLRREAYLMDVATANARKQYLKTGLAPTFAEAWAEVMSEPGAVATRFLFGSPPVLGGVAAASADGVVTSRPALDPVATAPGTDPAAAADGSHDPGDPSAVFNTPTPLSLSFDGYGREIFVESEDEHTGKPAVWYQLDRKGNKFRHVREGFGVLREQLVE